MLTLVVTLRVLNTGWLITFWVSKTGTEVEIPAAPPTTLTPIALMGLP
jgi:hypothetical protein